MQETVASVKDYGILIPTIVRPRAEDGYEMISGHRRKRTCELAGLDTMPAIVRSVDDDDAIIIMVDSNLQRSGWARKFALPGFFMFEDWRKTMYISTFRYAPADVNCMHISKDATLYLLTTNAEIFKRAANCFCKRGIEFGYTRLSGISPHDYTLLSTVRGICSLRAVTDKKAEKEVQKKQK